MSSPQRQPMPERLDRWLRHNPLVTDGMFAGAVGLPLLLASLPAGAEQATWGLPMIVGVALRRLRPELGFGLVVAGHLAQLLVAHAITPLNGLLLISVYSVAAHGAARWRAAAPAVALAGAALHTARSILRDPQIASFPQVTFGLVVLGGSALTAWSLGAFRGVRLRQLATERQEQARRAVADERARIAREMHDLVAHSLAVIVVQADGGRYAERVTPGSAAETLETIAATARRSLTDMRSLISVLRAGDQQDAGARPGEAPQPGLADVRSLVDTVAAAGRRVTLLEAGQPRPHTPAVGLSAYRIVQEALTNVLKHAGPAAGAEVRLDWQDDRVRLEVCDDGSVTGAPGPSTVGHGLRGMAERAALVGGTVTAGPRPGGGGFAVTAVLPYEADGTPGRSWAGPGR